MLRSIKPYTAGIPKPIIFKNPVSNQTNPVIRKNTSYAQASAGQCQRFRNPKQTTPPDPNTKKTARFKNPESNPCSSVFYSQSLK
jgi:hypothetical protein